MITGSQLIAAERDNLTTPPSMLPDELASAAAAYAFARADMIGHERTGISYAPMTYYAAGGSPEMWPWARDAWQPTGDAVFDLVKAGGLIAAAIDALLAEQSHAAADVVCPTCGAAGVTACSTIDGLDHVERLQHELVATEPARRVARLRALLGQGVAL